MNPAQKALWYIESHLAEPLTLDDVAGVAGVSRFHLVRAFATATGFSVMRYVRARFSPDLYIVNIVHNDIQDSLAATTGDRAIYFGVRQDGDSFKEVPPKIYQPSLLRRIIGHWAIARYLYVNLGLMWKLERRDQAGFRVERQNQPRQFEANIDVTKMMGTQEGRQLTKYIFANTLTKLKTTVRSWCF